MTTKELQAMSAEELLEVVTSTPNSVSLKFGENSALAEILRRLKLAGGDSGASPAILKGQRQVSLMRDDGSPTHVIPAQLHSPPVVPRLMCDCKRLPQVVHLFTDECQGLATSMARKVVADYDRNREGDGDSRPPEYVERAMEQLTAPAAPLTAEGAAPSPDNPHFPQTCQQIMDDYNLVDSYLNDIKKALHIPANGILGWAVDEMREAIKKEFCATETARADRAEQTLKDSAILYGNALSEIEAWKSKVRATERDLATSNQHASELNDALAEARKALTIIRDRVLHAAPEDKGLYVKALLEIADVARAALTPKSETTKENKP